MGSLAAEAGEGEVDGMGSGSDNNQPNGAGSGERHLEASRQAIDRFLDAAWMERGLSKNTLTAYRTDLVGLARWIAARGRCIDEAQRSDILGFIAERVEGGARPRSSARQLSSFRRFFRWAVRERGHGEDPTAQVSMPKIGRPLPKSLTEDEVEALLDAPDTTDALGFRDRAMLEVLYATGLRVTELVSLRLGQVNLNQGVVRITGKGGRERLIPLGEESLDWLQQFIAGPREEILLEKQTDFVFPTRRGDKMTRQAFWHIIKRYTTRAGIGQALSPHDLSTTQIYTHVARERLRELHSRHHPRG